MDATVGVGAPAPKKRRMAEWSHFIVIETNGDGSAKCVKCKHCDWKGSANATRLREHLEKRHLSGEGAPASSPATSNSPSVVKFLERGLSQREKDKAVDLLLRFKLLSGLSCLCFQPVTNFLLARDIL